MLAESWALPTRVLQALGLPTVSVAVATTYIGELDVIVVSRDERVTLKS